MPANRQSVTAPGAPDGRRSIRPRGAGRRSAVLLRADPARSGERRARRLDARPSRPGRCLENLAAVCDAAGATPRATPCKLTVYLTDMSAFVAVNEVYASFFESDPPARVAIGVAALPRGAQVEIDAVVALPD